MKIVHVITRRFVALITGAVGRGRKSEKSQKFCFEIKMQLKSKENYSS